MDAGGQKVVRRRVFHAAAFLLVSAAYLLGYLDFVDLKLAEVRQGLLKRSASQNVVLIEIDAPSLREISVWPWPRSFHAQLIENLREAGAERIVFDVDFSSRSAPREDDALEQALAAAQGIVVLPSFKQHTLSGETGQETILAAPLPRFARYAGAASANVRLDRDGLLRRMEYFERLGGRDLPSLFTRLGPDAPVAGGSFYVDYGIDPATVPRISYADILLGRFEPADVAGKSVLIGATAVELGDSLSVPVYGVLPGALIQILAYESNAQGRALTRVSQAPILLITLLVVILLSVVLPRLSWRNGLAVVLSSLLSFQLVGLGAQAVWPVMIDTAPMSLLVVFLFIAVLLGRLDRQSLALFLQERSLRQADTLMQSIFKNSFEGIVTFDQSGRIKMVNAATRNMFGYTAEELIGTNVTALLKDRSRDSQPVSRLFSVGDGRCEFVGVKKNGAEVPLEWVTTDISMNDESIFMGIVTDISERREHEKELQHQALHDALTGLPNRYLLSDRLSHALEIARRDRKPLGLLMLDLNRFKEVNDTLGHHTGDQILIEISQRIQSVIRKSDTAARLGGDTFLVLLPAVSDLARSEKIAKRIVKAIKEPILIEGVAFELGVSIGISLFPEHGEDADALIQCADVAISLSKSNAAQITIYDPERDENSVRHLSLSGELRTAIQQNQLVLHYQPKVDLATGRTCSAEALVRWVHPVHGFIPPDEFIGRAERSGMIRDMTRWVLNTSLAQLAEWRDAGIDISLAVNISTVDLQDRTLPELVEEYLQLWSVDPQNLTLEITENAIMVDPAVALEVVSGLSEIGVRLSIDDFGTGHSSLSYLKKLPVNEMKIDRSFVMHMTLDQSDQVIVRSTINLAHNLGLSVVAEGIESDEHMDLLKELECDIGQGFHISRPVPADQFADWYRNANLESVQPEAPAKVAALS